MQYLYRLIYSDQKFHELEGKRRRFNWLLTSIVVLAYFGFILVIAFVPEVFARPVIEGRMITWGILAGLSVILLSFCLTGAYVYRANTEFDHLIHNIISHIRQSKDV